MLFVPKYRPGPCFGSGGMTRGKEQGFTLLELVVVCALIGIMLSLGVPSFRNAFFTDPLKSSARRIVGLIGGVRELAVRTQQPYFVHLSREENRLWYERDGGAGQEELSKQEQLQLPEGVAIAEIRLDLGETPPSAEPVSLWITRQGYMQETRILIKDDEGKGVALHFLPFIDTVQLTDPSVSYDE